MLRTQNLVKFYSMLAIGKDVSMDFEIGKGSLTTIAVIYLLRNFDLLNKL